MAPGPPGDSWLKQYDDAKQTANDTLAIIQERNLNHPNGGSEASRITALSRKALGGLGSSLDRLQDFLEDSTDVSENEKNRRRDLITALRNRRDQMLLSLKREHGGQQRQALFGNSNGGSKPRETDRTAELGNAGVVQLQQSIMREQDDAVDHLERSVQSTRHVALDIHEELESQNALLENFELDVEESGTRLGAANQRIRRHVAIAIGYELEQQNTLLEEVHDEMGTTNQRMQAAQKRMQHILRDRGSTRITCALFGLAALLVFIIGIAWRLF